MAMCLASSALRYWNLMPEALVLSSNRGGPGGTVGSSGPSAGLLSSVGLFEVQAARTMARPIRAIDPATRRRRVMGRSSIIAFIDLQIVRVTLGCHAHRFGWAWHPSMPTQSG